MQDNYEDMKHLSRPQYDDLPAMSEEDRAAQFSSFAALVGYDDAVAETARLTDSKLELTEDAIAKLNADLERLADTLDSEPLIMATYFLPDERKAGGRYVDKVGVVRIIDSSDMSLVFFDGDRIPIADLYELTFL